MGQIRPVEEVEQVHDDEEGEEARVDLAHQFLACRFAPFFISGLELGDPGVDDVGVGLLDVVDFDALGIAASFLFDLHLSVVVMVVDRLWRDKEEVTRVIIRSRVVCEAGK